jgi:hypothetical protein
MTNKNLTALSISLLASLALAACGGSSSNSSQDSAAPSAQVQTTSTTPSTVESDAPAPTTKAKPAKSHHQDFHASKSRHVTPKTKQALGAFVTCMRQHGIDYPAPNTSGKGKLFEVGHLDRTSPKFKSARGVCTQLLLNKLSSRSLGVPVN